MRSVIKKGFLELLDQTQPDVLCIQEARVHPDQLTPEQRQPKGYTSYFMPGKIRGYSGTAVYSKKEPLSITSFGRREFDDEGRVQVIEYPDFTIVNGYWPNSQPERKRIDYKLKFIDCMRRHCGKLVRGGKHVIICGDFNIAHTEIDLARPKQNENNPGYLPEERAAMTKFLSAGYVDTFRAFHPQPGRYSWWSFRGAARAKNVGWRIDYHCVNKELMDRVKHADILDKIAGSDHCPVELVLRK